jgi:hypothetical protein
MIVRRLTAWVREFSSQLAARLRRDPLTQRDREPVLAGSLKASATAPGSSLGGVTATHWLDDARRMRPRRVRSIPLPQPKPSEAAGERLHRPHVDSEPLRSASSVNSTPLSTDAAACATTFETPAARQETPREVAAGQDDAPATGADLDDTLRRRLRSLQFLVRHGIYNEGFADGTLPEQYRHSRGADLRDDLDM